MLFEYLGVWIKLKDKHPSYNNWKAILRKLQTDFIEEDWIDIIKQSINKQYATFCSVTGNHKKESKKFNEYIVRDGRYDSVSHERGGQVF